MTLDHVNYGLIVCGKMAPEHIATIQRLQGAQVSVVYDPVIELAQSAASPTGGSPVAAPIAGAGCHRRRPDIDRARVLFSVCKGSGDWNRFNAESDGALVKNMPPLLRSDLA